MVTQQSAKAPKPRSKRAPSKKGRVPELSMSERIIALSDGIPDEVLDRIPTDAAKNIDHYLYGSPKVD